MSDEASTVEDGQYLSFTLGGEDYGVDILKVQEIKGWEEVRPLPDTPEFVLGVLDFRGTIVPIVDLRSRFGLKEFEYVLRRSLRGAGEERLFLSGADEVPPEYRELVEEYYRALARSRRQ